MRRCSVFIIKTVHFHVLVKSDCMVSLFIPHRMQSSRQSLPLETCKPMKSEIMELFV